MQRHISYFIIFQATTTTTTTKSCLPRDTVAQLKQTGIFQENSAFITCLFLWPYYIYMHGNKKIVHARFSYVLTPAESFHFRTETKHLQLELDLFLPLKRK